MKTAVVIGSLGQDGSILCGKLREDGYRWLGIHRSGFEASAGLWQTSVAIDNPEQLDELFTRLQPDEVYYLAAFHQSSEDALIEPAELYLASERVNTKGVLLCLEAMRKHSSHSRFFYAASSHVFGRAVTREQNELSPKFPSSIYGITKSAGVDLCRLYRESYGLFACAGILYNHESPLRAEKFLSRKIARAVVRIKAGLQDKLQLGSLKSEIDWGYAPDYVEAMRLILQQPVADDYVIASGVLHSVQDFVETAFAYLQMDWRQYTVETNSIVKKEQTVLLGNAAKLRSQTGWKPSTSFEDMVRLLVDAELEKYETGLRTLQ